MLRESEALLDACRTAGVTLATAESCTGGLIAATLTAIAGSSDVVDRGFVTYANEAKTEMLGVPADLIAAVGAVSEPVAAAMAAGAVTFARHHRGLRHRRRRTRRRQPREARRPGMLWARRGGALRPAPSIGFFRVTGRRSGWRPWPARSS